MSGYNVNNGETLTLDHTLNETIDYINVNDGVCNITNDTDSGLVLQFASSGFISVKSFGQLNVLGKMVEIGTSDGSSGQQMPHWQTEHPVNVIWVETGDGTDEFEPWYGIDPGTSTALDFTDFGTDAKTGRVFKWNGGMIAFAPDGNGGMIPPSGARVVVPNIIISTETPFGATTTARFNYDEGGRISLSYVSFSDFNGTLKGMSHIDMRSCSLYGSGYIQYCNDFYLEDVHGGIKDNYSTGLSISYASNGVVRNISGASVKSKGVTFNYLKNLDADGVYGLVGKRDSSSDYPVFLSTVQGSTIKNVTSCGGALKLSNTSKSRVEGIVTIDNPTLVESSYKATSNIDIESSSDNTLRDWEVPSGGGAKIAYLRILNSPDIDVVAADIKSAYATNVVSADVSFNARISELRYDGFTGSTPFFLSAKNNGLLLQHITSAVRPDISIESPNAYLKGVEASTIKGDNAGAYGSSFAQLYTGDTDGKLVFIMQKDSIDSNTFKDIVGGVKFSNNGRVYFTGVGDTVQFATPYRVKGVTLKNVTPSISGYGTGALAFDYAIDTGDGYGPYKALTGDNLSGENVDPSVGFLLKIRAVAGTISGTCYVSTVELETNDSRYVYPLDYEIGKIVFDSNAVLDNDARYYVYYADGYGTADAMLVRDADGIPVTGLVDGADSVEFTYDFIGNSENGRTPGEPFGVVVVLAGKSMAQNTVIEQEFNRGQINVFNIRPEKEYAYVGV